MPIKSVLVKKDLLGRRKGFVGGGEGKKFIIEVNMIKFVIIYNKLKKNMFKSIQLRQ